MTTEQFVQDLSKLLGTKLRSVVLYGSAVTGDFVPGVSGHDILIVADPLGEAELAKLATPIKRWEIAGNPLPRLFTPQELAGSADVFPIELLDMQQSRRVLMGVDPLAELTIDMRLFRIQLERELKIRLMQLRHRYLECSGQPGRVADLLSASISTFLVLLRGGLRLYNIEPPLDKAQALALLAEKFAFNSLPLAAALELRKREIQPTAGELKTMFAAYLQAIEHVVQAVDRHLHGASA